jgi:peptidoglycan L-alanyl-D-glutamate endopeptidase CwlK
MDLHTETRISELAPPVQDKARRLIHAANLKGIDLRVTQALRSWNMQAALYAQGREDLYDVNERRAAVRLAPIDPEENREVTKAAPGHGWHEFGLAFDVCPFDQTGQPDWNEKHPVWEAVQTMGEAIGLKAGCTFRTIKDGPHFQFTGRFGDSPDDEVRQLYQSGGTIAVWEEAFAQQPREARPAPEPTAPAAEPMADPSEIPEATS